MYSGDEVEDLARLLAFLLQQHPEVDAVCSGAIASDYQRRRVEHVCGRLGVTSLAPLWHRPQSSLLDVRLFPCLLNHQCEHVCGRLGVTSLAPLWHRPQHSLLDVRLCPCL